MSRLVVWIAITLVVCGASAQTSPQYRIRAVAGSDPIRDGGPAREGVLLFPRCVVEHEGALYICDGVAGRVRRVSADDVITTIAGTGVVGASALEAIRAGEGRLATKAQIEPTDLAVDATGNVYVADAAGDIVRRIGTDGILRTLAGTGVRGFAGDGGPAVEALLAGPSGVALGPDGALWIGDSGNDRIRQVKLDGTMSRVAGAGDGGSLFDFVPALVAHLDSPRRLEFDPLGNLVFADRGTHRARRIMLDGSIDTIAGVVGTPGFGGDGGDARFAWVERPQAVAPAADGSYYLADLGNNRIRKVDPQGAIATVAGDGSFGFSGDGGPALNASFSSIQDVAIASDGGLYVVDTTNSAVRKIWPDGTITTIVGGPRFRDESGDPRGALLFYPNSVRLDRQGRLLIADTFNHVVRRIGDDGKITTIIGRGGLAGEGPEGAPAREARFFRIRDIVEDSSGVYYFSDWANHRVSSLSLDGRIRTFAGIGDSGFSGDGGPARSARISFPRGLAIDADDNVYVATGSAIRRIDRQGIIRTMAGTGDSGFNGDGGLATESQLRGARGLAFTLGGELLIADANNHRIRKVDAAGIITTIAGTGEAAHSGDGGPASEAAVNTPHRLDVGWDGSIYIGDSANHVIRMIDPDGVIHTIAGGAGDPGHSGDGGLATEAQLLLPKAVAVDRSGTVFLSDNDNHRVRALYPIPAIPEGGAVQAASFTAPLAPGAIGSLFGANLAGATESASGETLPIELADTSLTLIDQQGVEHDVSLFFASRRQINFLAPSDAALGDATLVVRRGSGEEARIALRLERVAPGVFSADASGSGPPAASYLRVRSDGTGESGFVFARDPSGRIEAVEIDLGPEGDEVFLTFFATGVRGRSSLSAVRMTIGGEDVPLTFAEAQTDFFGLDQVNVGPLPRSFIGRGAVDAVLEVDGFVANATTLRFR